MTPTDTPEAVGHTPIFPVEIVERLFAARSEYAEASQASRDAAEWARKAGSTLHSVDAQYRSVMDAYAQAMLAERTQ